MSTIDSKLEWPRFCYSSSKDMGPDGKKLKSRKLSHKTNVKISGSVLDGGNNHRPPLHPDQQSEEKFAFSRMMRQMAEKYQGKTNETDRQSEDTAIPTPSLAESLPQFPIDPLILRAAFGPFFPFPLPSQPSLFPSFSSSHALIALASRNHQSKADDESASNGSLDTSSNSLKRERFEDPLDLSSSTQPTSKRLKEDEDGSSIEDPETWSVDQVAMFVANVETCQEYAEIFRNHSIDGSALMELTENHMTRILGLKLGPAIKLRICIKELLKIHHASGNH